MIDVSAPDDLISRAAAIAELMQMVKAHEHEVFRGELLHYTGIKAMLEAQPDVDAIPVVRCRDCKEWEPHGRPFGTCNLNGGLWLPCDFCSEGERRDDDAAD